MKAREGSVGDSFPVIDEYQRSIVAGLYDKTAADVFDKRRREAALKHGWIRTPVPPSPH
jgi:hypothetical protein